MTSEVPFPNPQEAVVKELGKHPNKTLIRERLVPTILDTVLATVNPGDALTDRKDKITKAVIKDLVEQGKVTPQPVQPGEKPRLGEVGIAQILFWTTFPDATETAGEAFTEAVQQELEARREARENTSSEAKQLCKGCSARGTANCPAHGTYLRFRDDSDFQSGGDFDGSDG